MIIDAIQVSAPILVLAQTLLLSIKTPFLQLILHSKNRDIHDKQFQVSPSKDAWQELAKEVEDPGGPYYVCLGVKDKGTCSISSQYHAFARHVS